MTVNSTNQVDEAAIARSSSDNLDLFDLIVPLIQNWRVVVVTPLAIAGLSVCLSFLVPNTYSSRTTLLPPLPAPSASVAALAQLGSLAGLAGISTAGRNTADQYAALLRSQAVLDRIVDEFELMKIYDARFRFEARDQLNKNLRTTVGRKDGLITIEVDDADPQRAARMANSFVMELSRLVNSLALTEAQQRRIFMENQLNITKERLTQAQRALQSSGFSSGALKADARTSAEAYARIRTEMTAAELQLQALKLRYAEGSTEVQQVAVKVQALKSQLARSEQGQSSEAESDYISRFREFKYQETLFDLFARQYEMARVDESREASAFQVVDTAAPAEWKSSPRRGMIALLSWFSSFLIVSASVILITVNRRRGAGLRRRLSSTRHA
jgi:uncharacterized protein involved in exopolysaccharide biosynthesis